MSLPDLMKLFSFQRQYCEKNKKSIPRIGEQGLDLFQIVAALRNSGTNMRETARYKRKCKIERFAGFAQNCAVRLSEIVRNRSEAKWLEQGAVSDIFSRARAPVNVARSLRQKTLGF